MLKRMADGSLLSEKTAAWLMLAVAGVILLSLQASTTGFFDDARGFLSSDAMSWARNLAVGERHGVMYEAAYLDENGQVTYEIYHRFPPTIYWLISLICRAAPGDLATQTMLACQLMNVFVCVAMCACFGTLATLGVPALGAASAVLLTFSSRYLLFYNDMVFHNSPTLAGVSLMFMAIALQHRGRARRRHVVLASVAAVSLGWQAFAVLGAWWLVQVAAVCAKKKPGSPKRVLVGILSAPASICSAITILWGMAILVCLMLSEWGLLGGRLLDCPSIRSMVFRLTGKGGSALGAEGLRFIAWPGFLARQAQRILGMMTPVASWWLTIPRAGLVGIILLALGSTLIKSRLYMEHRIVWASITLSGFVWALVMRHYVAFHDLESIFYIGIPLTFWGLLALWAQSIRKGRAQWVVAILCLVLYVTNVSQMNHLKDMHQQQANAVTAQFQAMQPLLGYGKVVYVDPSTERLELPPNAILYYIAGNYKAAMPQAEYAVSVGPVAGAQRLTNNPQVNLYHLP